MKDLMNFTNPRVALAPQSSAVNVAMVGPIIDKLDYESVTIMILLGALFAGSSFAISLEHGDDPALADTSAPAATDLIGTLALAGGVAADANKCKKIGYIGSKRYLRMTLTPAANGATSFYAATAVLSHAHTQPTVNPPV